MTAPTRLRHAHHGACRTPLCWTQLSAAGLLVVNPLAGEHLVEAAAYGVDVAAAVEILTLDLIRRQIGRRAENHARAGGQVGDRASRQPDVEELHAAVRADHDIARIDVAVDDAVGVRGSLRAA